MRLSQGDVSFDSFLIVAIRGYVKAESEIIFFNDENKPIYINLRKHASMGPEQQQNALDDRFAVYS